MPVRFAIHVPTRAVAVHVLDDGADLVLGRAPESGLMLVHESVSRRHARLLDRNGRWTIEDLGSKNGLRVDGHRVERADLAGHRWLAVGDVFCEFEEIAPAALDHLRARAAERRETSRVWTERVAASAGVDALMDTLLRGIVAIAECRRGFLLVADPAGKLRVGAADAIDPGDVEALAFSGSKSAVDRSIAERRAVYLSDRRDRDWLSDKASVVARGIRALASVPLLHDGNVLGVAYADTDDEAKVFTDLDAELLGAFAARAAATLAATRLDVALAAIEGDVGHGKAARAMRTESGR